MTKTTFLAKKRQQRQHRWTTDSTAGFTVVEVLTAVIMVGILAAMAGAGYLGWMDRMRVGAARDVVMSAISDAQTRARQQNITWQVSFKQDTANNKSVVKWAVHPSSNEFVPSDVAWQTIEQTGIKIDPGSTKIESNGASGPWRLQFNSKGQLLDTSKIGKPITLTNSLGGAKRCVIITTILGAVRTRQDDQCQ